MIRDSTGRKIKQGQLVDLPMNGMFKGNVVEARESLIDVPGAQKEPPFVIVQVLMKLHVGPDGRLPNTYITAEAQHGNVHPFKSDGRASENESPGDSGGGDGGGLIS